MKKYTFYFYDEYEGTNEKVKTVEASSLEEAVSKLFEDDKYYQYFELRYEDDKGGRIEVYFKIAGNYYYDFKKEEV